MKSPTLTLACLLVMIPLSLSAEPPAHPRLLATSADFERIRNSIAQPGPLRDAFDLVRATADREYDEPVVERVVVGRRLLATSRTALRRIANDAVLYRLTGDKKWAARGEKELLALAAFSDWNPSHFLDTAEASAAVAIGYDWLYDALPVDSRARLRDALVRLALVPGDSDRIPWRGYYNNWRQVCEAGLALAALAVAEDEPALAQRAVDRALNNVPKIFDAYEPAGAYVEGTSYWDYGTSYHVLLIEALRTATGSSGVLAENRAFLQSASVMNLLTGPSGDCFNYGDAIAGRALMPAMYWFARETGRSGLVAGEDARLKAASGGFPSRFLAFALLWMPAGPAPKADPLPAAWFTQGYNPLALFRHGDGPDSLYAGMKGGRARLSHAHMDAGSFIFEAGGVRWTADLGMPDYHSLESAGVDLFGKDRWKVYALGPHSHSIPLIDDLPPDEQATATLTAFSAAAQSAVFDLTTLYKTRAASVRRGLRIENTDTLVIRDELAGVAAGAVYRFSWMTRAAVETDADGAVLRQNGKTLRLSVSADADVRIVNEDASQPPTAYDAPLPGLRRLSVLLTVKKPAHAIEIRARLGDTAPAIPAAPPSLARWPNELP